MEPLVIALVLAAAVMHAVWNTVIKVGEDRLLTIALVMAVSGLLGALLLIGRTPPAPESWIFIALSAAIHTGYYILLIAAYRVGDLSHAYPLARGSAPMMVAAGAALFAGELLSLAELAGIAIVSAGIFSLMATGGFGVRGDWRAIAYPLATGVVIAIYTVIDGLGVRASGSAPGYIGWLFIFEALPICVIAVAMRGKSAVVFLRESWKPATAGGVLAFGAYALIIWTLSFGTMAHISALRETSVVIAALIGTRLLGEPFGARRVASAIVVAGGVVVLHLAA
jgi:drug/metabolite transporter (DMT)-like permease